MAHYLVRRETQWATNSAGQLPPQHGRSRGNFVMLGACIVSNQSLGSTKMIISEVIYVPEIEKKLLSNKGVYPLLEEAADLLSPTFYDHDAAMALLTDLDKAERLSPGDRDLPAEIESLRDLAKRYLQRSSEWTLMLNPYADYTAGNT
jgi:hypothetical protein